MLQDKNTNISLLAFYYFLVHYSSAHPLQCIDCHHDIELIREADSAMMLHIKALGAQIR